ncbi:hypothetical protein SCE1572_47945 [Sorangium cellulosum So0157-2]|uniref:Uncharacterized protein n=1 Tax=Sorangium cellulosum So0157-2 TaxID=1254432 RepID=S4YB54_SORCE|nr:hypothetical protein SCE1572_47945 [Sorangium cellulosum So0157-2]
MSVVGRLGVIREHRIERVLMGEKDKHSGEPRSGRPQEREAGADSTPPRRPSWPRTRSSAPHIRP